MRSVLVPFLWPAVSLAARTAFISGVVSMAVPPAASLPLNDLQWTLTSDGTARQGGRSMGEVTNTATGVRISGSLEALPSDTLGPVAFVIGRATLPEGFLANCVQLTVTVTDKTAGQFLLYLYPEQLRGQSNYIAKFMTPGEAKDTVASVRLDAFEGQRRGKPEALPALESVKGSIEGIGIGITRSVQPADLKAIVPLQFAIEVSDLSCGGN
ncbi:unnamed protein product [Vitrella brassicaformis CCMP3155]|uniref:NADH:ubiquinone oxidoreductase intermediate-associated protein 30 domain-containing protein n=2 Tax=Vitrella brassicaformis TaxID=1169539 RepID=A0A0G4GWJ4_VITBC|nr:unnamed protein product [Vitrella brassicaformis CCMP3155]|eukprot:CEM35374.1 unnamed protein product [Vitrella brassicaformis CCMP3155]